MKHIVIDARIISSTTGRYVERLLFYLQNIDTDNKYTVLVRKKDENYWEPHNKNFSVMVADYPNYSFAEQFRYWRFLRRLNADLVHFCTPEQPILYRGKKITTIHDLTLLKTYNPDKNWFVYHFKQLVGRFVFWYVVKTSEYILTPSRYTKKDIQKSFKVKASNIHAIHLAAETKTTTLKPYPLPSKQYLLFVGQQSHYKNIRTLQKAHAELLTTYPDLLLVLVGKLDKPGQENKQYFESIGAKNIIYTGFVEDEQLNWLYHHTSAYIFPSYFEGFGLPGLEAMLHGAPVISSNATCLPEIYGAAALYFDPSSSRQLAQVITTILSDSKVRSAQISAGYTQAKKYSWKKTAQETHEFYQKVLSSEN